MNQDVKALPAVAYVESWPDDRQAFGMQPLVEWRDLPEGTRLVRQSDAESALAELRAEVERLTACIEQMTSDLARCRDAFGIPAGDGHLSDAWTSAMAMPEEVPHYVEAAAANLERVRRAAQRALDAWDSTVFPQAHDGMMQERMEELREECIEQARVDKQRADTAEARLERARGLLSQAMPLIKREADSLSECHTIGGEWDEESADVREVYEAEMTLVVGIAEFLGGGNAHQT